MQHRGAMSGLGWDGLDWVSLGGVRYRPPCGANNDSILNVLLAVKWIVV